MFAKPVCGSAPSRPGADRMWDRWDYLFALGLLACAAFAMSLGALAAVLTMANV